VTAPQKDTIDIDALMEGLRQRVAEKKAQGLYGVDALMAASVEDDGEPFGLEELEALRELAVQTVDIDVAASTKPVVGGLVSQLKRLLVRGASQPMYGMSARATAFNAALLGYLSTLAREVSALERRVAAEQAAADAARAEAAAARAALSAVADAAAAATAAVARLADAALPERVARLERGPATAAAPPPPAPAPAPSGALSLRLEATEADPDRDARLDAHAAAFPGARVVHAGAGSGWALERLGPEAEGVEADGELAAAGQAAGRAVHHADPAAYLAALAPESLDGVLITGLVERLDGPGVRTLLDAAARVVRPGGAVVVEGWLPAAAAADPAFWRDPERRRALHPDAVRMTLEGAGLGTTRVVEHPGADPGAAPSHYAVHASR
jgi:hypothetical protein